MKIYVGHSRSGDFKRDLYDPIRKYLNQYDIVLPHENDEETFQGRDFYKNIDLFIAEVSSRATGLGIELGYASDDGTPIYCIYRKGTKYSRSLENITDNFYEYRDVEEMIKIMREVIKERENELQ